MRAAVYKPKALIAGKLIGLRERDYVAVPDKFAGKIVKVQYSGLVMYIRDWRKEAEAFRRFRDKFWQAGSGRSQYYTLGYFPFHPEDPRE